MSYNRYLRGVCLRKKGVGLLFRETHEGTQKRISALICCNIWVGLIRITYGLLEDLFYLLKLVGPRKSHIKMGIMRDLRSDCLMATGHQELSSSGYRGEAPATQLGYIHLESTSF